MLSSQRLWPRSCNEVVAFIASPPVTRTAVENSIPAREACRQIGVSEAQPDFPRIRPSESRVPGAESPCRRRAAGRGRQNRHAPPYPRFAAMKPNTGRSSAIPPLSKPPSPATFRLRYTRNELVARRQEPAADAVDTKSGAQVCRRAWFAAGRRAYRRCSALPRMRRIYGQNSRVVPSSANFNENVVA